MAKATYVDGFVLAVPKKRVADYRKMARLGLKMWKRFGALDYKECIGDDLKGNPEGMSKVTFPGIIKLKKDEVVWFSFITYKSKKHRDLVNKKVMAQFAKDYAKQEMPEWMMKMRMAYGGFKVEVS
jgi:uncharacterized protein YbaA (DUF1428 family)